MGKLLNTETRTRCGGNLFQGRHETLDDTSGASGDCRTGGDGRQLISRLKGGIRELVEGSVLGLFGRC